MSYPAPVTRRSMMLGALGAAGIGAISIAGSAPPAYAQGSELLDYTSPEAFEVARQAYLDRDAQHNEAGLYAWGESYYLLSLLIMFERYGDETYLDELQDRARHVYATTDEARGVSDYTGKPGPVWRASGNYTAGHANIALDDGRPGIQLRWAGTASADALAIVTAADGAAFDLELTHPASTETLTGLGLDPSSDNYVVDAVAQVYTAAQRWTAVDLREHHQDADRLAGGEHAFEPQFYAFAVHTGMVCYPLARYIRTVMEDDALAHRRPFAARLRPKVMRSMRHHDTDLHFDDEGRADFRWPRGAPIPFDGLMQPLNQSHALGATYAEFYRITGSTRYRRRVEAIWRSLESCLERDGEAYVWRYWPLHSEIYRGYGVEEDLSTYTPFYGAVTSWEDISHAAISLEFVEAAHGAGVVDLASDRARFATTYIQNVIRDAQTPWFRVDGTTDAVPANTVQAARWLMLADEEPGIHDHVLAIYEHQALVPDQGSHALGIAYLNLTK